MHRTRKWLPWFFLLASVGFLVYRFHTTKWDDFSFLEFQFSQAGWWLALAVLLPMNWLCETFKWKRVLSRFESISFKNAFRAVLAGMSTAFVSPNRIGDIVGRMAFLQKNTYIHAPLMAMINGMTQTLAILVLGFPSAYGFFRSKAAEIPPHILNHTLWFLAALCVCLIVMFLLPRVRTHTFFRQWRRAIEGIGSYNLRALGTFVGWSMLRFGISCLQMYAMLRCVGVTLSPVEAILCIPSLYLFVTFTPSFSVGEGIVRGSWAVFFIGAYSNMLTAIAFAGIGLWLLNVALPSFIGNVVLLKTTRNGATVKE